MTLGSALLPGRPYGAAQPGSEAAAGCGDGEWNTGWTGQDGGEARAVAVRSPVLDRLKMFVPERLTLDFHGSVLGTTRMPEGTAVGYYKKNKETAELLPAVLHRGPDRPGA